MVKNSSESNIKTLSVDLRLHPSEKRINILNNFNHLTKSDVWDDLENSDIVIACVSTCLYQASFIGKQPIIWMNGRSKFAYNNLYPFKTAADLKELTSLIHNFYNQKFLTSRPSIEYFKPFQLNKIVSNRRLKNE